MSVLKQMDWFEELESVNVDNKVIDVGDELDDDSNELSSIGFDFDRFSEDSFSIGIDYWEIWGIM